MRDTKIIKFVCTIITILTLVVMTLCAGAFELGNIRAFTFVIDCIAVTIVAIAAMGVYSYAERIEEGRRERGKRKNV